MTCNCVPQTEIFGSDPANVQWRVVRGDTGSIRVQFLEDDEVTGLDTSSWVYEATAYNPATDTFYTLQTISGDYYVDITALPEDTLEWGTSNASIVAELSFDLEVTISEEGSGIPDTVWTPVIGTICVLGDTTGGSL